MGPGTRKSLTGTPEKVKLETRNGRALCPICGRETKTRIGADTVLDNFQLYCDRCKQTSTVYREPEP